MKLRVLIAHTRYQQRGGEDQVVEAETDLLREQGHAVELLEKDNKSINGISNLGLAKETIWSRRSCNDVSEIIGRFRPDVIHAHNTFPLISPSVFWTAAQHNVPTILTLHNFRLLCPQAMLLRKGGICEECIGKIPWRGIMHRCYRNSALQTGVISSMNSFHRLIGTYKGKINAYIALTNFSRAKFIEGGLPANNIYVKPNFVDIALTDTKERSGGLYVGRLSPEKGLHCLTESIKGLNDVRLNIIGTGDLSGELEAHRQFKLQGWMANSQVHDTMRSASYLVMPSIWYEGFPVTLIEAFACGLPVIASRIGSLAELIKDGETGLLVEPSSSESLKNAIIWAERHPAEMAEMGIHARKEYETKYTSKINYEHLINIYQRIV